MSSATTLDLRVPPIPYGPYPERREPRRSALDRAGERAVGGFARRWRSRIGAGERIVAGAGALEEECRGLTDRAIGDAAAALRSVLRRDGFTDVAVARSFALVREVARRRLDQRPHDVQLLGGFVLLSGMLAEMETGEGKTLTATLPAVTAALAGIPVHVITVNDYLVGRDAEAMGPIYESLGLSVGAVRQGMAFEERRNQYALDVVYCSNKDLAFDYLRDRLALGRTRTRTRLNLERLAGGGSRLDRLLLRGLHFGIVDEADSVLIDEARTPLVIAASGDSNELEEEVYETAIELARTLAEGRDFWIDARGRRAVFTPDGESRLAELAEVLEGIWKGQHRREQFVLQALSALHLFERDQHYLVDAGKVQIIDEYTGRRMPDRTWERGLHQMIEAKEGCEISGQTEPLAKISYQRFFPRYLRLAGMTGTASEVAGELWSVYRLPVVRIPTHRPLRRTDAGLQVHVSSADRWNAVVERVRQMTSVGRPVLIGTRSVAASEELSRLLDAAGVAHGVLNARQDAEEADLVSRAGEPGAVTVATNMAGRGTDVRLPEAAVESGGLHVIATELHDARRIDRQLFGRCGRQGDPGSFEVLVSLDDELVTAHGAGLSRLAARGGPSPTSRTAILRRFVMRLAQLRAERLHARMRRALLSADEQIKTMLAFSGRGE